MAPKRAPRISVSISVRSLDGRRGPERRALNSAVLGAAGALGPGRYVFEIAYADESVMRRLNRRFHHRTGSTDVLAFPSFIDTPHGMVVGEVVVNRDAARRAAPEGGGVMLEMLRYVVHGVLHLAGFDDHNPAAARKMWKKQEEVLQSVRERSATRKMRSSGGDAVPGKGRG